MKHCGLEREREVRAESLLACATPNSASIRICGPFFGNEYLISSFILIAVTKHGFLLNS